ncbi:hypothetical protein SUNI508_07139 [Seiridium unicorne]|uniref:Uncharacterized protein n=1 Tax=Seiridium unicorne TaxID=138068 RepID=A0ABR2UZ05_9PEZI
MASNPSTGQNEAPTNLGVRGEISNFVKTCIRNKFQELAFAYDAELQRDFLPQLRFLLNEIEKKHNEFKDAKRSIIQEIGEILMPLEVDSDLIDTVPSPFDDLHAAWRAVLRPGSPLKTVSSQLGAEPVRALPQQEVERRSSSPSTLGRNNAGEVEVFVSVVAREKAQHIEQQSSLLVRHAGQATKDKDPHASGKRPGEEMVHVIGGKRSKLDDQMVARMKTTPTSSESIDPYARIDRRIELSELHTSECVFQIPNRTTFYVIRCDSRGCSSRVVEKDPFKYKRAFNHFFRDHTEEPLTEAEIFERYAYEVTDATEDRIEAHTGIAEIPECTPRLELPTNLSRPPRLTAVHTSTKMGTSTFTGVHFDPWIPDDLSNDRGSLPEEDDADLSQEVNNESEKEQPSRALRQQPRPPYAAIAQGLMMREETGNDHK